MGILIHVAARELGLSTRTLDAWARNGKIKFTRSAGGWRMFDADEIEKLKAKMAIRSSDKA